jgi:hypothetical protein
VNLPPATFAFSKETSPPANSAPKKPTALPEVRAGERDLTAGESCFEKPTSPPVNSAPKK